MAWRILSLFGGLGGLGSLVLPYALVSGGVLGLDLREEPYTLFELARLLERAGNDPRMVYLLAFLVLVGSTMVLVGSVAGSSIALAGGFVQGGAAAAFAYGVTAKGSKTLFRVEPLAEVPCPRQNTSTSTHGRTRSGCTCGERSAGSFCSSSGLGS